MGILGLGVSFRRAPIELLERLAFSDDDLAKAYEHAAELEGLDETVILSTCNRVEVYGQVASYHAGFLALRRLLAESRGVELDELAEPLVAHWERDAAEHLFSVAAGPRLDGARREPDRLAGPRRDPARRRRGRGRARRSPGSSTPRRAPDGASVRRRPSARRPDAFVALGVPTWPADALGGSLEGRSAAVVGAGQMASLAVKHLRSPRGRRRPRPQPLARPRAGAGRRGPTPTPAGSRRCPPPSPPPTSWSRPPAPPAT